MSKKIKFDREPKSSEEVFRNPPNFSNKHTVKINFDNETAAKHFLSWLCGAGEQDYWEWQSCRESEEDGAITAIDFDYWGGTKKGSKFGENLEVNTTCGRLDKNK